MTTDQKLADFRQWTLSVLDLLGADSDRQAAYLQDSGVEADEILLQFDDVLHVARVRVGDGSLRREDYLLLQPVSERAEAVNAGSESIWAAGALEEAVEWRKLRVAARVAKSNLESSWSRNFGD